MSPQHHRSSLKRRKTYSYKDIYIKKSNGGKRAWYSRDQVRKKQFNEAQNYRARSYTMKEGRSNLVSSNKQLFNSANKTLKARS